MRCVCEARSSLNVVPDFTRFWVETAPSDAGEVLYQLRCVKYNHFHIKCQIHKCYGLSTPNDVGQLGMFQSRNRDAFLFNDVFILTKNEMCGNFNPAPEHGWLNYWHLIFFFVKISYGVFSQKSL